MAGIALGGLAWAIGSGTEIVGGYYGPAVTSVLQTTLGNLPELFVVLFALSAGEIVVAQFSIIGSLFANALLVLGLVIVAGASVSRGRLMRFGARLPNDTATLLLLAVFIIVLLGLSDQSGDRASHHAVAISIIGAVCLLGVYGAWLWSLPAHGRHAGDATTHRPRPSPTRCGSASGCSLLSGAGAALVSDWFVAALDPGRRRARDLEGVHRPRDRRDRRQRGRERRRHHAGR